MRKITALSLIFSLTVFVLYGQEKELPLKFEKVKIKGNINSLNIKEGNVKENKGNIEFVKPPEYTVITYNQKGNLTEEQVYKNKDTLLSTTKYYYDDKFKKVSDSTYDANKKLTGATEYKYDNNGYVIEEMKYDSKKKLLLKKKYIYNVRYKVSELKYYNAEGNPGEKYSYFYNINGNVIIKSHYKAVGGLDYKMEVLYNDKGIPEMEKYYDNDGNLTNSIEYYTLEKGNEAITCLYGEKNMIDKVCYHKYTYDKHGNPVKNIILSSDSFGKKPALEKMQEIEIEYY